VSPSISVDGSSEQNERIWVLLGELKGQLTSVHQAIEVGAAATLDRLNQQSSRIEKESERIDKVVDRVQRLENGYSRQSGGFSLAGWVVPLIVTLIVGLGGISVAIYSAHLGASDKTGQP
jgi:hypothetical protein